MTDSPWRVYIIETDRGHLYTGVTTSIERRLAEHSGDRPGGAKFFRGQAPRRVMYVEPAVDRAAAQRREHVIKRLTRAQKLALIATHSEKTA